MGNIVFLHDQSGGRGIDSIDLWPRPEAMERVGYAGGLKPSNIVKALKTVRNFKTYFGADIWLDMETGVRTNDWFDLDKVELVLERFESQF